MADQTSAAEDGKPWPYDDYLDRAKGGCQTAGCEQNPPRGLFCDQHRREHADRLLAQLQLVQEHAVFIRVAFRTGGERLPFDDWYPARAAEIRGGGK